MTEIGSSNNYRSLVFEALDEEFSRTTVACQTKNNYCVHSYEAAIHLSIINPKYFYTQRYIGRQIVELTHEFTITNLCFINRQDNPLNRLTSIKQKLV